MSDHPMSRDRAHRTCDVAIIGGGPSGLAAAMELKRLGAGRVVVLEREAQAGGIPRHCGHPPFGLLSHKRLMTGPSFARLIVREALDAGVEILPRATVMGLHPGGKVDVSHPDGSFTMQARRVLMATGVRETPRSARLVSGTRALGILNTGALQGMVYLKNLAPFRRPLIVGSELVSLTAVFTCRRAGIRPVAMIEPSARPIMPWQLHQVVRALGVPLRLKTQIDSILGHGRVEAVRLRVADGSTLEMACDGVLFTGRFTPESSLARSSHLSIDAGTGGPLSDQFGRCSDPAFFATGNLLRPVEHHEWCWREGKSAARWILQDMNGELPEGETLRLRVSAPIRFCMPQLLVRGAQGGMGQVQLRVAQPVRGRLCVSDGENLLWARNVRAMPEQRILIPTAPLLKARRGGDILIRFA